MVNRSSLVPCRKLYSSGGTGTVRHLLRFEPGFELFEARVETLLGIVAIDVIQPVIDGLPFVVPESVGCRLGLAIVGVAFVCHRFVEVAVTEYESMYVARARESM